MGRKSLAKKKTIKRRKSYRKSKYYRHAYLSGKRAWHDAVKKWGKTRVIYLSETALLWPEIRVEYFKKLEKNGIPFLFKKSTWYGGARVYVPEEYYKRAKEILKKLGRR